MTTTTRAVWRYYVLFIVCAVLATAAALFFIVSYSASGTVPHERYYRAVFVLQSLGGPAAGEREDIPGRVPYADATESLLHHPDKIFVLGHVAEELAQVRADVPRAALFEAYARLGLGDRREAARLLAGYVVESDYDAGHYGLLCRLLHEQGDYPSLLLICREWLERDAGCRADRIRFTWAALHNLERYAQAADYMLGEGECLGWRARVHAARSVLALSGERAAGQTLEAALSRYADDAPQILRLWNQLKARDSF